MTFSVVLSDTQHEEDFLTVLQFDYMEDGDEIKLMLTRQLCEEDPNGAKEPYQEMHAIVVNYRELLRAIDAVAVNK